MANELATRPPEALTPALKQTWLDYERTMHDKSENTLATYGRALGIFADWVIGNGGRLDLVTPMDVADFKQEMKTQYSPQTVNLWLTAARRFYAWAVATGYLAINPAREVPGIKRPGSRTHKRDRLTDAEVRAVLATCDTSTIEGLRDKVILVLFSHCALRQVEIHRATLGDVATRGDRLVLYVSGKGHTEADEFVVVSLSQEPLVHKWLALRHKLAWAGTGPDAPLFPSCSNNNYGGAFTLSGIRHMVKERYALAGVVSNGHRKTTHSLRHSAITKAIQRGATPMQTQAMARHKSLDTTLGYYHEEGRTANPAEDLIDYDAEPLHTD